MTKQVGTETKQQQKKKAEETHPEPCPHSNPKAHSHMLCLRRDHDLEQTFPMNKGFCNYSGWILAMREHSPTWVCTEVRGWCGDVYICRFASPFSFLFPFSSLFEMAPLLSLKLEASNRLTARVSRVLGAGAYRQRQAFVWVLGVQSRVLMLRQQLLYPLSYLPTSKRAFKA